MKIIVGLGNPGKKYENTRHNMGYEVLDSLAEKLSLDIDKKSFDGVFARFSTQKGDVILFKPTTYMNLSGVAVQQIMQFYKVGTDDIIVVFDDMSLPPGSIRLRLSGSSGGQKGIQNIIDLLGTTSIKRIKVGIGEPQFSGVDYVLSQPTPDEKPLIDAAVLRARDAVIYALEYGFEKAMSKFNVKKEKDSDSTE